MKGLGAALARKLPPPGKAMEPDDGAASELSAMEDFADAMKGGSAEEKLSAFKTLVDLCRGYE